MNIVTCNSLSKSYHDVHQGDELVALEDISFAIERGEFLVIVGPSGCGKSTLLNLVAGFEKPTTGEIFLERKRISGPGADRAVVFQEYALFPWLTVRRNVEYGPRQRGLSRNEAREISDRYLDMVGLSGFENRFPHELSGGMRQRAAIARALANDPKILLMDEPFAAVDAQTRALLQRELVTVWANTSKTVVFITHSVEEAVILADRVMVMTKRPGRIKSFISNPLERPRDPTSPQFNEIRREVDNFIAAELQLVRENIRSPHDR